MLICTNSLHLTYQILKVWMWSEIPWEILSKFHWVDSSEVIEIVGVKYILIKHLRERRAKSIEDRLHIHKTLRVLSSLSIRNILNIASLTMLLHKLSWILEKWIIKWVSARWSLLLSTTLCYTSIHRSCKKIIVERLSKHIISKNRTKLIKWIALLSLLLLLSSLGVLLLSLLCLMLSLSHLLLPFYILFPFLFSFLFSLSLFPSHVKSFASTLISINLFFPFLDSRFFSNWQESLLIHQITKWLSTIVTLDFVDFSW